MSSATTSNSHPLSPTELVHALQNFGLEEEREEGAPEDLDAEDEEVTVSGVQASTTTSKNGKGKGKLSTALAQLSVEPKPIKSKKLRGLLRSSTHSIVLPPAKEGGEDEERVLTSWKMADYAYKRDPCPFPTRARGLFTEKVGEDEYSIVARGYDKFFNVGEVSWTQWDTIAKYSTGPYELTQKSNGCIILISTLSPSQILVTSKHSIGAHALATTEGGISHSQRGEYWLDVHLARVGKTKADLAAELHARSLTAVAELCDDSFEEHVLAYPSHLTGLHLHGLNLNTTTLSTLPSSSVASFATTWGLIPTPFSIFPSVPAVQTYCSNVESTGGVEDPLTGLVEPVEGFVVRGRKRGGEEGEPFFWKVKYDEPYLMYREWRELTRKLLASYPDAEVRPGKLRNEESRLYLWWVDREIRKDVGRFESWKVGKGIIRTRDEFLEWAKGEEARGVRRELGQKEKEEDREAREFDRTLVVPIAVQGCGKTSLGIALGRLLGWGHTQSDDFTMKKSGPHFIKSVKELLGTHEVVYADKNNHVRKLRTDLVAAARSVSSHRTRLIALVWPIDSSTLPRDRLHALCAKRIVERGEHHQSLRAGEGHESAIWQFLGQHEAFEPAVNKDDGAFDEVIVMRTEWSREEALEAVVARMVEILEIERPSEDKVVEALEFARAYKPTVFKAAAPEKIKEALGPRYYGISVEANLDALLATLFPDDSPSLFDTLRSTKRIEPSPHITLVHSIELRAEDLELRQSRQEFWDRYASLVENAAQDGSDSLAVEVTLGPKVVWDSRAMAIEVSGLVSLAGKDIELPKGGAHVTVGTLDPLVRPVEGKWLLDAVGRGEEETKEGGRIEVREMERVVCRGRLAGLR